jgi:transcription elongation factor GreA
VLNALQEIQREWAFDRDLRKSIYQTVRNAISASDYAAYREAISQMDEGVAGTIKRLIERLDGLAEAVKGDMLAILRENFFVLFAEKRIDPWLDEGAIYTTREALNRYQDDLRELQDVKMLENSRAIGAAAEHGDLSENSEWKFAIEEQKMLQARAAKMQQDIAMARVLDASDVPTDRVGIGSKVTLRRADGAERTLEFLGPWDADPDRGVYSYQTKLGQALMGRSVGDEVTLSFEGDPAEYTLEAIGSALGEPA